MKYGTQLLGKWIAIALAILLLPLSSFAVAAEEILDVSTAESDTETKIETSSLMPCLYITTETPAISLSDLKSNSYQVTVSVYADVDVVGMGGCSFGVISDEGATFDNMKANASISTAEPSNQDSQFVWVALGAALDTISSGTPLCTLTYTIDSSVKTGYVYCFSLEKQNRAGTQGQINNEDYTYGSPATITIGDTVSTSTIEIGSTSIGLTDLNNQSNQVTIPITSSVLVTSAVSSYLKLDSGLTLVDTTFTYTQDGQVLFLSASGAQSSNTIGTLTLEVTSPAAGDVYHITAVNTTNAEVLLDGQVPCFTGGGKGKITVTEADLTAEVTPSDTIGLYYSTDSAYDVASLVEALVVDGESLDPAAYLEFLSTPNLDYDSDDAVHENGQIYYYGTAGVQYTDSDGETRAVSESEWPTVGVVKQGDVDLDENVEYEDAKAVSDYVTALALDSTATLSGTADSVLEQLMQFAADVDGDGTVTYADAESILRYYPYDAGISWAEAIAAENDNETGKIALGSQEISEADLIANDYQVTIPITVSTTKLYNLSFGITLPEGATLVNVEDGYGDVTSYAVEGQTVWYTQLDANGLEYSTIGSITIALSEELVASGEIILSPLYRSATGTLAQINSSTSDFVINGCRVIVNAGTPTDTDTETNDEIAQAYFIGGFGAEAQNWSASGDEHNLNVSVASITGDGTYTVTWDLLDPTEVGNSWFLAINIVSTSADAETFTTDQYPYLSVTLDEVWIDGELLEDYTVSEDAINLRYYEGIGITLIYLRNDWVSPKISDLDLSDIKRSIQAVFTLNGLDLTAGDVDEDGTVTQDDAALVFDEYTRIFSGDGASFSDSQTALADVNADGVVDLQDVYGISAYAAQVEAGGEGDWDSVWANALSDGGTIAMDTVTLTEEELQDLDTAITIPIEMTESCQTLAFAVRTDSDVEAAITLTDTGTMSAICQEGHMTYVLLVSRDAIPAGTICEIAVTLPERAAAGDVYSMTFENILSSDYNGNTASFISGSICITADLENPSLQTVSLPCGDDWTTLSYLIQSDETIVIVSCDTAASGSLQIPAKIDGISVSSIGGGAYADCSGLTEIMVADGITEIGSRAFANCTALTSVSVPDSITKIGANAFINTPFLTKQTGTVKYAGSWAIACTSSATSFALREDTLGIADCAFTDSSVKTVTLPKSLISIGDEAFAGCSALSTVQYLGTKADWSEVCLGTDSDGYFTAAKLVTAAAATTTATSHTSETTITSSIQTGDADLDGNITIQDASITLQYYAQLAAGNRSTLLEGDGLTAADVNGDGSITIQDAAWILEYYAESAAGKTPSWETLIG